jgi:hypothetical protein
MAMASVFGIGYLPTWADEPARPQPDIAVEAWADAARSAYRPISEEALREDARKLLGLVQVAETALDGIPNGGVIRRQMDWEVLKSQLSSTRPDVAILNSIYRKLCRRLPDQAKAALNDIDNALRVFVGKLEFFELPDGDSVFQHSIDQLSRTLQAGGINDGNVEEVRQAYEWLVKSNMLAGNLKHVRNRLSYPNEIITVRRELVKSLIPPTITKSADIKQRTDKLDIKAHADILGNVDFLFVPNPREAEFRVQVKGTGKIPITLTHRLANIRAGSNLTFSGNIGLNLASREFRLRAHQVCLDANLHLQNVCLKLRSKVLNKTLDPLAECVLKKLLPDVEAKAEEKLRAELDSQLNDSGYAIIVELNALLNRVFWDTFESRDIDTQTHTSTTADEFLWREEVVLPWTLAAPSPPPAVDIAQPPFQMHIHESMLNNAGVAMARRRYDEVIFRELVFGTFGLDIEGESEEDSGRIAAAFTFTDEEPLRVRFDDDAIEFGLRIRSFEWQDVLYEGPDRDIRFRYDLQRDNQKIVLNREPEFRMEPAAKDENVLRSVLDRFFVRRASLKSAFNLKNSGEAFGISLLRVDNGWLQILLSNREENSVPGASSSEGKAE